MLYNAKFTNTIYVPAVCEYYKLAMSQTSISARTERSTSKTKAISIERKTTRRYSDINIMMLEGHHAVAPEEEKAKLLKKREELYQMFRRKYILDENGHMRTGIASKKMENGN